MCCAWHIVCHVGVFDVLFQAALGGADMRQHIQKHDAAPFELCDVVIVVVVVVEPYVF